MKPPRLKKQSVKSLVQGTLLIGTLWLLVNTIVNWRGARARNLVSAEMTRHGLHLTVGSLLPPLPPDDQNFATLPIFVKSQGPWQNSPATPAEKEAQDARERLHAMEFLSPNASFAKRSADQHYEDWGKRLGCAADARSCLRRYDEINGAVLAELRQGLSRPFTQSSVIHGIVNQGAWGQLNSSNDGILMISCIKGLVARAHAALASGEPDIAFESLVMGYRINELIGSNGLIVSVLDKGIANHALRSALQAGLETGAWNDRQLSDLEAILIRIEFGEEFKHATEMEMARWLLLVDYLKQERGQMYHEMGAPSYINGITRLKLAMTCRLAPDGWFDLKVADRLELHRRRMEVLSGSGTLATWWALAESEPGAHFPQGTAAHWLYSPEVIFGPLLRQSSAGEVEVRLARTACALERYRLAHGRYPANLAFLEETLISDPFTDKPFGYEISGSGYRLYSVGPKGETATTTDPNQQSIDDRWIW